MSENQNLLCHFTSLETLIKIISSGRIRLTRCMDVKNAVVETIALHSALHEFLRSSERISPYYSLYGIEDNRKTPANLIKAMLNERKNSYMTCFTEATDESDLYENEFMWEYFANNGEGVAIEFDRQQIPNLPSIVGRGPEGRDSDHGLCTMEYDTENLCIRLNNNIDEYNEDNNRIKALVFNSLSLDRYKPECCKLEKETRLLVYLNISTNIHETKYEINNLALAYKVGGFGFPDIRHFHPPNYMTDQDGAKNPKYLEFDITSKKGGSTAIKRIHCKNKTTMQKLESIKLSHIEIKCPQT